jgi:hypothetical protein
LPLSTLSLSTIRSAGLDKGPILPSYMAQKPASRNADKGESYPVCSEFRSGKCEQNENS